MTTTGARTWRPLRRAAGAATALLLAAPLVVALPGGTAAAAVVPVIEPATAGNTAVKFTQFIRVKGSAPADGAITAARLIATEVDGDQLSQRVEERLFTPAPQNGEAQYLTNKGGTLEGSLVLDCYFAPPIRSGSCAHEHVRTVRLEVTVRTASGAAETGLSDTVRVDYTEPTFRFFDLVSPDTIRVRFSEPVRNSQNDLPTDWRVSRRDADSRTVLVRAVERPAGDDCVYEPQDDPTGGTKGCTRLLRLAAELGEDEIPSVEYVSGNGNELRQKYNDFAGTEVPTVRFAIDTPDRELIRPGRPTIDSVGGTPIGSDTVAGRGAQGAVSITNVTAGHHLRLRVTDPDGSVDLSESDVRVRDGESSAQVPLPAPLTQQGAHRIEAIAVDPSGNLSTESDKDAARDDGRSVVTYVLDSVAPVLLSAVAEGSEITVTWNEAVLPADNNNDRAGEWKIRGGLAGTQSTPVTGVRGSGPTRVLTYSGELPSGARVTHEPASAATTYRDAVGNEAQRGPVEIGAIAVPVITAPVSRKVEAATTTVVTGTAAAGSLVQVHRDAGNDGQLDAGAVAAGQQLAPGATAFNIQVPLTADADNHFTVTATDTARGLVSRAADLPTIVQDSIAPVVRVTVPAGPHAGEQPVNVTYSVADENATGRVVIEVSTDGGQTWGAATEAADGDGESRTQAVLLPKVHTQQALVRVSTVDAAGRAGNATSVAFEIDAVLPSFTARTGPDRRTVTVVFNEVVTGDGRTRGTDWEVANRRALAATSTDQTVDGRPVTVTVLTLSADLGPNDLPVVGYAPLVPAPLGTPLRDRALQPVRDPAVATDGIAPAPPVVREPAQSRLTREATVRVAGTAEPGSVVEVRRGGTVVGRSSTVPADGTWAVTAALAPDSDNDLSAIATDTGRNLSAGVSVPRISQDSSGPSVTIDAPANGTELTPGAATTITWRTADRNAATLPVTLYVSTDGGLTYAVIARDQAPNSSYIWTVPDVKTGKAVVRVDAVDALGNTTRRTTGFLGIGQAADGGTPPPVVVEVTAVTLSVNDRTITAGNAPLINGTATDADGRPVAGEPIRVFQKVWGQSAYTTLDLPEPVRTDSAGRYAVRVRPDRQRSYVVQVGAAKSRPLVIAVANRVNVARPVGGSAVTGGATTVVGDLDPDFASVRVGVAVLRNGRFGYVTQGLTDSTGAYSIPVRGLPRGDYALVVYTSARQGTGAGAASRAVRVS